MKPLALVLLVGLWAAPLHAVSVCSQNCVVKRGTAFSLVADDDGIFVQGFRAYVDGTPVADLAVSALQPPGVITFSFGGLSRGAHQLVVSAYNASGEVTSDPVTVTASSSGK
jgi:hypothetical protein